MSGTKKDRESLKNRFKKGMYPTEDDFADVFESYVHKDDTIKMSQVVLEEGGESVGEVIDKKADKKTLDAFIEEVDTVLETVRDAETGEITKTVIQDLTKRIEDAEEDLADAANNAEKNGDAVAKILTILGKQDGETVSELAERFSTLSGSYATVYAFVSKVKAFLESADASDETINRWQEIESFLQGITDKETLTGLLESLKTEIMQSVPKGNFLKLVDDLDAYTDASDGEIVKYTGQTNEKYTRGFDYERKAGDVVVIPQGEYYLDIPQNYPGYPMGVYRFKEIKKGNYNNRKQGYLGDDGQKYYGSVVEVGSYVYKELDCYKITAISNDNITLDNGVIATRVINDVGGGVLTGIEVYSNGKVDCYAEEGGQIGIIKGESFIPFVDVLSSYSAEYKKFSGWNGDLTFGSPSSWQLIPASPVIY